MKVKVDITKEQYVSASQRFWIDETLFQHVEV